MRFYNNLKIHVDPATAWLKQHWRVIVPVTLLACATVAASVVYLNSYPVSKVVRSASPGPKCTGLVLTSGGSRGAYQAGVLHGLAHSPAAPHLHWDIISGVSVGALNTLSSLGFNVGEEAAWSEYLENLWNTIKQSDVYEEWFFREIEGLLAKSGIYNNAPLFSFLNSTIAHLTNNTNSFRSDRLIIFSATKIADGLPDLWTEKSNTSVLIDAVIASSTIPGIFPIKTINGIEYVDGGVLSSLNIKSVVERCKAEKGVLTDSDITIDIVSSNPFVLDVATEIFNDENSIEVLLRANYLSMCQNTNQIIADAKLLYPHVNYRFHISPNMTLPNMGLDFNHGSLFEMIELGKQDGAVAAQNFLADLE